MAADPRVLLKRDFRAGYEAGLSTVATPFWGLPFVTLLWDTWHQHILPNRPYLLGREGLDIGDSLFPVGNL